MTSAPTHDITDASESNEADEKAVIESSQIMVKTAENALKENKYFEKVVILEHHMRHDHESKANLVHLANRGAFKYYISASEGVGGSDRKC